MMLSTLFSVFRRHDGSVHPAVKTTAKTAAAIATGAAVTWLAVAVPFVANFEGYSARPYYDSVHVKTICYGATAVDHVDFSKVYTKAECEQMLGTDLQKYDRDLQRVLAPGVYKALPPHRHAALVSFDYNLGLGNTARIAHYFNQGRWQEGCQAMLAYTHAGGRVLQGLINRRRAEYKMCMRTD